MARYINWYTDRVLHIHVNAVLICGLHKVLIRYDIYYCIYELSTFSYNAEFVWTLKDQDGLTEIKFQRLCCLKIL